MNEEEIIHMRKKYVIAYDLGTSGVKAALIDLQGQLLSHATAGYPMITPRENWAEQDPNWYWDGVCAVTRTVLGACSAEPEDAQGIVFCTQWKGIIPVDASGEILHNCIIWLDARAGKQAVALNRYFGRELFCAADYWPKLAWLRENDPEIYNRAAMIFEVNSYLKWKATGIAASDYSNHFVRSFDPALQAFYNEFLTMYDMDISKFPGLVRSTDLVGVTTVRAAGEMGLVPGIPVFGGCNDIQAISVGAGSSALGGVHTYFGSSGWMGFSVRHTFGDLYLSPFDEEKDISIYGLQSIGLSYNWAVRELYAREMTEMGDEVYRYVDSQVSSIPAGSRGLFATPWFYGERPPLFSSEARGTFLNLGAQHDRRYMVRAVMEGVCYMLKMSECYSCEQKGLAPPGTINVVGGGSESDVWMQMLADVLNIPVRVPEAPRHAGTVGAAYCALIGLGLCKNYEEASEKVRIARVLVPQPEAVAAYAAGFAVFRELHEMLSPLFKKLNVEKEM